MIFRLDLRLILITSWVAALIAPFVLLSVYPQDYFFNVNAIGNLLASYFIGGLGIAIAGKKLAEKEKFYLFLLSMSLFLWNWAEGLGYCCRPNRPDLALNWFKTANVGVVFIAAHVYSFTANFLELKRPKLIGLAYAIGGLCAVLSIATKYFVSGVQSFHWGFYPHWNLINTAPYFLYFSTYLSLSLLEYLKAWRRSNNQHTRSQINYLMFAFGTSYLGSIDYLPAFGYDVYPFGYIAVMGWWSILAYAILKHRLMDITIIIRKTLVYSVVMGALTCVYLGTITLVAHLTEGLTGYQTIFSSAIAAGLITVCFQPLRKKVQAFVDMKFFRQYVDREEKLYELSRDVVTHVTPEAMGSALVRVIEETLHPKSGAIYLRHKDGSGFSRAAAFGVTALPERMSDDGALAAYLLDHPQPFVQDLPSDVAESQSTRKTTARVKVA